LHNLAISLHTNRMKLRIFAARVGVRDETARRWFKVGLIRGYQLPTGTIIITETEFHCRPCGHMSHADVNAAEVIAERFDDDILNGPPLRATARTVLPALVDADPPERVAISSEVRSEGGTHAVVNRPGE